MEIKGTEIIIECLRQEKVKVVFGIPGAAILPLFDTFGKFEKLSFQNILSRHEQGAIHAADGYARATGEVGVCIVTSGPGATNLVTGLANAYMDSIPLIAFTGQVETSLVGNDAFQEVDITGITTPITKYNYMVRKVEDLALIVKEAFYIARTGRPGPVLIDLPKDVLLAKGIFSYSEPIKKRGYKPSVKGHINQIKAAAKKIMDAERPIIIAGGGIIKGNAAEELMKIVDKTNIPVISTFMGLGSIPKNHPLYLGMLGMYGQYTANHVIGNADLIIALGTRFDDRITGKLNQFCTKSEIIHVDVDPAEIGKNVNVKIPIVGDLRNILQQLHRYLEVCNATEDSSPWFKEIEGIKKRDPFNKKEANELLSSPFIMESLNDVFKGDEIIVTDVGQHQMWAANHLEINQPRNFISSGGLGTMGFGLPAAIGAKIGRPEKAVVCIAGDGGFQMNIQEIATAVCNQLSIIVILMNNSYLGMVRQLQELFCDKRYISTSLCGNPDFVKVVESYGGVGFKVERKEDFIPTLKKANELNKFVLIDCHIPAEENVFPLVKPDSPIDQMIGVD